MENGLKNRDDLKEQVAKRFNYGYEISEITLDVEFGGLTCTAIERYGKIRQEIRGMDCGFIEDYES